MKTWLWVIPIGITGVACFEHFRYIITHKQRKNKLLDFWEPLGEPTSNGFWQTLGEYVLLPLTYTLGFANPATQWKQRFFHSLNVAGRFVNPFVEWQDRNTTNIFQYLYWQLTRKNRNGVPGREELDKLLPLVQPNFELLFKISNKLSDSWHVEDKDTVPEECLDQLMTITWIGQSTCFVQMDGYNILTDPIFSTRTMGEWFGPKRLQPPACQLSDLPPIDIVLISHNHYDHLDVRTMEMIGNSATWYVPLGLKSWFLSFGIVNV